MAGYIEFSSNFAEDSNKYVLFEFPSELRDQLKKEGQLAIQEHKNESYIIGDDKLYQVVKFQISNLFLASEVSQVPTTQTEKYVVKSFQQSFLIPTVIKPFSREIFLHLKSVYLNQFDDIKNLELKVDFLKKKFVTNEKFLAKILEEVGAEIEDGYVVNLHPDLKSSIFNTIVEKAVEKGLLQDKDSAFSLADIEYDATGDDLIKANVVLKHYFSPLPGLGKKFGISIPGTISILLHGIKKSTREFNYEDLIDLAFEGISMTLPKSVQDSFGKEKIASEIESGIRKQFLISDLAEFNAPAQTYSAKTIVAVMTELELYSENPIERCAAFT